MEFTEIAEVVGRAAASNPNWLTVLIGINRNGIEDERVEIIQFSETKGGTAEIEDKFLKEIQKIFNQKLNESGFNAVGGLALPDVLDYTDDDHCEETEVNVNEMEEITEATENAPLPKEVQGDSDIEDVMQALDKISSNGTFSFKLPDTILEYETPLPTVNPGTPGGNIAIMTRMTRSQPCIVRFCEPEEPEDIPETSSENSESSESDRDWGNSNKEKIKAPNFLMEIDDSGDDMDQHSTSATLETARKQPKKRKQRYIIESDESEPENSPPLRSRRPKRKATNLNISVKTIQSMVEQAHVSDDEDMEAIEGEPVPTVSSSNTAVDIVSTEALRALGLTFNTRYKLLICELCQEGLPLCNVRTHL
ncbi:hypothetical protein HYPSUDRAFT_59207 [Hypholoma sublateritium FD-334 SS-4]|uniref:Uncharacterized protein n=1 Tax=Hypholoma sublateritium (strain FD-334 SS-4) TaxID=945553 RepID=A0A0D2P2H3_HYPSF|nr:hypothetical protein HYPSUDRAFT_59207 [Hypholoma sublateritium FD-334 SS-4]